MIASALPRGAGLASGPFQNAVLAAGIRRRAFGGYSDHPIEATTLGVTSTTGTAAARPTSPKPAPGADMPKTVDLDMPFRKGELVIATRDLMDVPGGTEGKVQLHNGLGNWHRYWVLFDGPRQMGQVDHDDLVRPNQLQQWQDRQEEAARAAERTAEEAENEAASAATGDGGGGASSLIPAHLLERSKAAKARLLG
ncbi:MAG: hypothetical protein ACR2QO_22060 [Acidimicrobiales bacterium]